MVQVLAYVVGDQELEQCIEAAVEARSWQFIRIPDEELYGTNPSADTLSRTSLCLTNDAGWSGAGTVIVLQHVRNSPSVPFGARSSTATDIGRLHVCYAALGELTHTLNALFHLVEVGISVERNMSLFYQAVTWLSHDGIICVDKHGIVTVFNEKASEVLGVPIADALGQPLVSFNPTAGLTRVLQQREVEMEDVISINGRKVAANRAPIIINGELHGAVSTFQDVTQLQQYEQTVRRRLRSSGFQAKFTLSDIVAVSRVARESVETAKQYGRVDATVLITGESGTGKEMFAQGIHNASFRARGPFVAVNCAALPEALLESELFGYDEGAFTGANRGGKQGLFELAHGGTIFLDEIGELPMAFQGRLLRVLQEREILRVGGKAMIPVDVRVIAATHQPLLERVRQGLFRSDLFYRLHVLPLYVPPLRDRKEDIVPLARMFFEQFCRKYNKADIQLGALFLNGLVAYDWPGNVRELRNKIERSVVLTAEHGTVPELDDPYQPGAAESPELESLSEPLSDEQLIDAYRTHRSITKCAEVLGVHRTTVWRRLRRLGVR